MDSWVSGCTSGGSRLQCLFVNDVLYIYICIWRLHMYYSNSAYSNCLELWQTKGVLSGRSILSLTLFRVDRA